MERDSSCTRVRKVSEFVQPPAGTYSGTWGGYTVRWEVDGIRYEAESTIGIRTPCAHCQVFVDDRGEVTVKATPNLTG